MKLLAPAYRRPASRPDGMGKAGPFDRALGPEHVEGLPGNDLLFHIVLPDPAYPAQAGRGALRSIADCGIKVKREDFQNSGCLAKGNPFGKPDLSRVEVGGRPRMVKDVRRKNLFFRWTLGLWLIHKEWKIYSRLAGIQGIPKAVERIDRFAFAMEFVPGRPIQREEALTLPFFSNLERVLREIHSRGVVHLDLRHKGNILLSETGEPFLIDFNSSFSFKEKGFLRRFLFPILRWVDYGGLLKLKQRVSPSLMTPEELVFLKKFNRLRKLWIFN